MRFAVSSGAGLPAAVLALLAVLPASLRGQEAVPSPLPVRSFELAASRFQFEPSLLEVEEGDRVVVMLRSRDVKHGFGIKELGVEVTVPEGGLPVKVEFVAPGAGRYTFACTEFCGDGHPDMKGRLLVYPRGQLGVASALPPEGPAPTGEVLRPDAAEPDFTVVNLPTALPTRRGGWVFRVVHRFSRPLGQGDFGDLAADLFGFDSGGSVGLEVRYGLSRRAQVGVFRTSTDRTISVFAQHDLLRQGGAPLGLAIVGSVEGTDNFREEHAPHLGLLVSRRFGDRAALYAKPAWVGNTRTLAGVGEGYTVVLGLGARLRLWKAVCVTGEVHPRLAGFEGEPGSGMQAAFGIERRVGGHTFQINVVNDLGTTPAQVARGRRANDWYVGFNISRKF